MPDHVENVLRKSGPLLAAAACIWGAGIFADELPDSVRQSALEELRVLDRVSTPKFRGTSASRPAERASKNPSPAKAAGSKPHAFTQGVTASAPDEITGRSSLPSAELPSGQLETRSLPDTDERPPTIRPARPTIARPPIRSKSASWNPRESKPRPSVQPQQAEPVTSSPATAIEAKSAVPSVSSESHSTPEASPFAEVLNDRAVPQAEAVNPFDTNEKDWRPATNRIASPTTSESTHQSRTPEPRNADPVQPQARAIAVAKPAEQTRRSKSRSEQIGADRPVSVLDFLAQNGEPVDSTKEIANAQAPRSSESAASGAFARAERATAARAAVSTPTINRDASAVVANGLPRSVQSENSSHQSLESIDESEASLATPPAEQVAQHDAPPSEQQKLDARAGRDGFMGYCPVTLRDHKTLVDGKAEFSSSYGGERFEFASAEAKAAFDADPSRYSPAHAGRDVVLSAGQIDAPGSLRHATYYKNRLYLFRSSQTCRLFESDPTRYVADDENSRQ